MVDLDRDECKIDIHHIFPRDWCEGQNIAPKVFNSIINKTPISYKANRMIGGKAPSQYLQQIRSHAQVQITEADQDDILQSHLITPRLLRADDFPNCFAARKIALLEVIANAMGKAVLAGGGDAPAEDEDDEDGDDQ